MSTDRRGDQSCSHEGNRIQNLFKMSDIQVNMFYCAWSLPPLVIARHLHVDNHVQWFGAEPAHWSRQRRTNFNSKVVIEWSLLLGIESTSHGLSMHSRL